ncbi:MAG: Rpn family recombination-promoting nuclease/putative transposase [Oscillospiraceae bacterium]|nr:Rpn family recombination-promoting nuclease/putative transposase [Oscillospiraceae bacterium]
MKQKIILPTSDLGFRKAFSTIGKEHVLQGFLQDISDADELGIKITNVRVGNPYNIINVNRLSEDERKSLLLHTELDIHCTTDGNYEVAIEL